MTNTDSVIAQLISGNDIYERNKQRWKFLLDSYLGGDDYRNAHLLTRYLTETDAEYQARLLATPLENHCSSIIDVYNSFLFRQAPRRDFGSLSDSMVDDIVRDADFEGRHIDLFMKEISTWSSVFGHCWVIVSKPDVGAITQADELQLGARPYLSIVTPLTMLDWKWKRNSLGQYVLSYIKYVEDINGNLQVIKEWTPEQITTTTVNLFKDTIEDLRIETNGLYTIPAVISYNKRSLVRGVGVSDLTDIADLQRFNYNAISEIEQSIRLNTHPSLVKTPSTNAGAGAGSIIEVEDNLDPGLKPYYLEFTGASIDSIHDTLARTIDAIDKQANVGAVRATESRVISGIALETEFQLLNAKLSEKADNLELTEEQIWSVIAMYYSQTWSGVIDYPGSFNIRDNGIEISQLKTAREITDRDDVVSEINNRVLQWLNKDTQGEV